MFHRTRHIHLVGIGGAGMSGIAEILLSLGFQVSGSDLKPTDVTRRLESLGARFMPGHREENIEGADVVVISSAIKKTNPEVVAAHAAKIPVIPRAEMLAEFMRMKFSIAVAGAHGKTTTTSMISAILQASGKDPTTIVGGKLAHLGSGARLGSSEYLVAEADESDGSFLHLFPTLAVVTNIDREHLDFYPDIEAIRDSFAMFTNKVPFFGVAFLNLDDENVRKMIPGLQRRFMTYGFSPTADLCGSEVMLEATGGWCEVAFRGKPLGTLEIRRIGRHNLSNALAALAVALELDIPFKTAAEALLTFEGVERRFTVRGRPGGVLVVDDYGHHPREIQVTLEAARLLNPHRLITIFQPHRFTRTKALWEDFCISFFATDLLFVLDVYPGIEEPIEGITSDRLAADIASHGHRHAVHRPDRAALVEELAALVQPGDLIVTLGAGDITQLGPMIVERIER